MLIQFSSVTLLSFGSSQKAEGAFNFIGTILAGEMAGTAMDSGYYAACTALMSRMQALDTVADNLANISTNGYRGQHNVFQSVVAGLRQVSSSQLNQAVNGYGVLGGTRLDLSQGTLQRTGGDYDMAVEGPGFFVVQTANGQVFTRNGNFHVSNRNELVTAAGDPVVGQNGPVTVLDGPMSVSADGTISVNGAIAGKLSVVEFPVGTLLQSLGQTYYSAPIASAKPAQASMVRQGMLEASNVSAVSSVVELISVQRAAEMMQRVLSLFNSDIDKVATQELPRVNS